MKLQDIIEHNIVAKDRLAPRVLKTLPTMKRTDPPFTKGAFKALRDVTGGKQIKNPAGGKVVQKSNTMKKKEISSKKKRKV